MQVMQALRSLPVLQSRSQGTPLQTGPYADKGKAPVLRPASAAHMAGLALHNASSSPAQAIVHDTKLHGGTLFASSSAGQQLHAAAARRPATIAAASPGSNGTFRRPQGRTTVCVRLQMLLLLAIWPLYYLKIFHLVLGLLDFVRLHATYCPPGRKCGHHFRDSVRVNCIPFRRGFRLSAAAQAPFSTRKAT